MQSELGTPINIWTILVTIPRMKSVEFYCFISGALIFALVVVELYDFSKLLTRVQISNYNFYIALVICFEWFIRSNVRNIMHCDKPVCSSTTNCYKVIDLYKEWHSECWNEFSNRDRLVQSITLFPTPSHLNIPSIWVSTNFRGVITCDRSKDIISSALSSCLSSSSSSSFFHLFFFLWETVARWRRVHEVGRKLFGRAKRMRIYQFERVK